MRKIINMRKILIFSLLMLGGVLSAASPTMLRAQMTGEAGGKESLWLDMAGNKTDPTNFVRLTAQAGSAGEINIQLPASYPPASGDVLAFTSAGVGSWVSPGGTGTVTSVGVSGGTTGLTTSGGPVTTAGTITLAGTLAIANGGTGATTASAAFNALSPMTTLGDVLYGASSGAGTRLAGNTTATKEFLTQTGTGSASAAPVWATIAAGDVPTLNQNTTGSAGSVLFSGVGAATNTNALLIGTGGSLAASGTGTITATSVPASGLTGSTLASGVTASSLTSVGTIATGVWNGTAVTPTYGGTGLATLTAHGVLIGEGTSNVAVTAAGTTNYVLTAQGALADPTWAPAPVTSVTNSDASLTISPTTGSVVASLNTAHANTFTGAQTLQSQLFSSTSETALTVNTNNWAITTGYTLHFISSSVDVNVTGIVAGSAGQLLILVNSGSHYITLTNKDASSTAANEIAVSNGGSDMLGPNGIAWLIYDGTATEWRIIGSF